MISDEILTALGYEEDYDDISYLYNDGGRKASGRKGSARDCGCRAMAIATGKSYDECYKMLADQNHKSRGKRTARNGILKKDYDKVLNQIGWEWCSAPKFEGRKARHYDMPSGVVIARMARHFVAVIDGVVHDTWDSTEKMVYGYWAKK